MRREMGHLLGAAVMALTLGGASACGEATPAVSTGPTIAAAPTASAGLSASTGPTGTAGPTGSVGSAASTEAGTPTGSAAPTRSSGRQPVPACDAVLKARHNALAALAPVAAVLAQSGRSPEELAQATNDLNTAYTAMHVAVATAADLTGDPQLKAKISAYQLAVEQAIVAVEGSDSEQAKLSAVLTMPAMRSAEKAVVAACS